VIFVQDSNNIIIKDLSILAGNDEELGCIQVENSNEIKIEGNIIRSCDGPGVRVKDEWNAATRSSEIRIAGNSFYDNGKVFGGGIRLDHVGDVIVENNLFDSVVGNGLTADCLYDDGGNFNLETNFCTGYVIRRNLFNKALESSVYLTSATHDSSVYSNVFKNARESCYAIQTTNGAWRSSGGSGLHITRGGHDNVVYNNLIYDIDRAGISLRAAVFDNVFFNNTISDTGRYIVAGGASVDYQRDYNEVNVAHNEPVRDNLGVNNIFSNTYGTSPCLDLDGYNAGSPPAGSSIPNGADTTNVSNSNVFFNCARVGKFNASSQVTLANLQSVTSAAGLARETLSQEFTVTLFVDYLGFDFRKDPSANFSATPTDIKAYLP
jgi:parallel beta-helix repeat protein